MNPGHRQSGTSLIGIMIGLLVALMAILALLTAYRLTVDVSINAIGTTQRDGQIAMALGAAQLELQQAGYGIERMPGAAERALLSIDDDGRRVSWRYRPTPDANEVCAGLLLKPGEAGGLFQLPPRACSDASTLSLDTPAPQPLATGLAFFTPTARDGTELHDEAGAPNLAEARFELDTPCTFPFAQQTYADSEPRPLAQALVLRNASGPLLSACLANIVVETAPPAAAGAGAP